MYVKKLLYSYVVIHRYVKQKFCTPFYANYAIGEVLKARLRFKSTEK